MSLSIRCPHCSSVRAVHPRVMGREIRCPDCDQLFQVDPSLQVQPQSDSQDDVVIEAVVVDDLQLGDPLPSASSQDASRGKPAKNATAHTAVSTAFVEEEEPEQVSFAKKELPKDDMDMTPMVDVTFLLLIFFMITASFSSEKVFEKPPPLSETPSNKPPDKPPEVFDTVRVQIDEFNAFTVIFASGDEREASSKQDLLIALGEAKNDVASGKDDEVLKMIVDAHEECIHASIVAALDAGRESGFSSFTVTVVEEFE